VTQRVSAEPQELNKYANFATEIDIQLQREGRHLAAAMQSFSRRCREDGFGVVADFLGNALGNYGSNTLSGDAQVGETGRRFARADAQQSVAGKVSAWFSDLRDRSSSDSNVDPYWLNALIGIPPVWLLAKLARISWIRSRGNTYSRQTHLGRLMQEGESNTEAHEDSLLGKLIEDQLLGKSPTSSSSSLWEVSASQPPKSPFGATAPIVTADFGTYGSGYLHNGVDIVPTNYTREKSYPVYAIAPGKVVEVSQGKKVFGPDGEPVLDQDGKQKLTGYGNYIVIEHELSDGALIYSRYAHLKDLPTLKPGQTVDSEVQLGTMGRTGNVRGLDGRHVHLEVYNTQARNEYQPYHSHKHDEKFDENSSLTWEQKMRQGFYDPIKVTSGDMGWAFRVPQALGE